MRGLPRWLEDRFLAGIGLAVLLFTGWQVFNHYFLMDYLMGRLDMSMLYYHYLSFMVELLLVALVVLFASRALRVKNRQLEELQGQKDTLVHALVHDLRQPLTAVIGGLAGATESDRLPEDGTRELVGVAQQGAMALLEMVNDLLDVARLESGAPLVETARISASDFVTPAVELLAPLADHRGVALQVALPPELPKVIGDVERLRRVVANLVGNALKFAGSRGAVTVGVRADEKAGQLLVSISDTGPGVPVGERARVFEKFACKEKGSHGRTSTGLGLYFCKLIVEAHGGRIWVDGEPGQGATFTFSLPLASAAVPRPPIGAAA